MNPTGSAQRARDESLHIIYARPEQEIVDIAALLRHHPLPPPLTDGRPVCGAIAESPVWHMVRRRYVPDCGQVAVVERHLGNVCVPVHQMEPFRNREPFCVMEDKDSGRLAEYNSDCKGYRTSIASSVVSSDTTLRP